MSTHHAHETEKKLFSTYVSKCVYAVANSHFLLYIKNSTCCSLCISTYFFLSFWFHFHLGNKCYNIFYFLFNVTPLAINFSLFDCICWLLFTEDICLIKHKLLNEIFQKFLAFLFLSYATKFYHTIITLLFAGKNYYSNWSIVNSFEFYGYYPKKEKSLPHKIHCM
jgi:hypothetical protein